MNNSLLSPEFSTYLMSCVVSNVNIYCKGSGPDSLNLFIYKLNSKRCISFEFDKFCKDCLFAHLDYTEVNESNGEYILERLHICSDYSFSVLTNLTKCLNFWLDDEVSFSLMSKKIDELSIF